MDALTPEGWILAVIAAAAIGLAKGGLALVAVISVPILSLVMSPVQAAPAARAVSRRRGNSWGILAGYTSFVSHSGGPPWQVYVQPLRLPSLVFAGTTTWFFAVVNWIKLVPYAALGQLSAQNLTIAAVLMPVALVSVWAGLALVRVIPQALFYRLITWGLLLVSARLVWQGLAEGGLAG